MDLRAQKLNSTMKSLDYSKRNWTTPNILAALLKFCQRTTIHRNSRESGALSALLGNYQRSILFSSDEDTLGMPVIQPCIAQMGDCTAFSNKHTPETILTTSLNSSLLLRYQFKRRNSDTGRSLSLELIAVFISARFTLDFYLAQRIVSVKNYKLRTHS